MKKNTIFRTRKPKRIGIAGLLLTLLALFSPAISARVQAQNIAIVRPEPIALQLDAGEIASVEILLENARNVYGIDVSGTFNPSIVEIVDADPTANGIQMIAGEFPQPDFVAVNSADNVAGTFRFVTTQVNPTQPATGAGTVFSFEVRGRAGGKTDLAINLVEMADRDGMLLASSTSSATIEVSGAPAQPTGIVLQPTEAPQGAIGQPSATPAGGATSTITSSESATTSAEAPPGATPITVATPSAGDTVEIPPPAATEPVSNSPSGDVPTPTAQPADSTGVEQPNPVAAVDPVEDVTAEMGNNLPENTISEGKDPSATNAPIVIGDAVSPGTEPRAASAASANSSNASTAAIIIGGVVVIGLVGFLLARMRKQG